MRERVQGRRRVLDKYPFMKYYPADMKEVSGHTTRPSNVVFAALSLVFFGLFLSAASSVGFVPYYIDGTEPTRSAAHANTSDAPIALTDYSQLHDMSFTLEGDGGIRVAQSASVSSPEAKAPARISIGAIDLDLAVQNPTTTDVEALDALLKDGPARYAPSAKLGERGNMIIFAHSSHLPVVHNQMYKAFNKIPELATGEVITLTDTDGAKYLYRVVSVKKVDVNDDVTISLAKSSTRLTLVTCDTLTGKSARFVLDAEFIGII